MAQFSYFDQFNNIDIDLTRYLNYLSTPSFKYTFSNMQPVKTTLQNLFTKYEIIVDYKLNLDFFLQYHIDNDEFIETVANKAYGMPEYWWIIALFNNITEPFKQWPLTQSQLITMATHLYQTYGDYDYQTYINFITEENDKKRSITIPKNETVKQIVLKYRQAIMAGNMNV